MYITIASYKGGVGKTTSAVHLAAFFSESGKTVLIDGDPNRSATAWAKKGRLPFPVVDVNEGAYQARNFEHVIIDTEARPGHADLEKLVLGCDMLIIPTVPATLDTDALVQTIGAVRSVARHKFRVLITKAPPPPENDASLLRAELEKVQIPLFPLDIPRLKCFEKAVADGVVVRDVEDIRAARAWAAYEKTGMELCKANSPVSLMSA